MSLGTSGRSQNRPVSVDAKTRKSQFTLASFSSVKGWTETAQNLLWRLYLKKKARTNDWLDYWSGRNFFYKLICLTYSMAGPTGPFATALSYITLWLNNKLYTMYHRYPSFDDKLNPSCIIFFGVQFTFLTIFFFFQYCVGQRFIASLSHTGGQARKN